MASGGAYFAIFTSTAVNHRQPCLQQRDAKTDATMLILSREIRARVFARDRSSNENQEK